MPVTTRLSIRPLLPLIIFSATLTLLLGTYTAAGLAPSEVFLTLVSVSWSFLLAIWLVADFRQRQDIPCFDFGFFCYLFFPVAIPLYCFWSRGWRGAVLLAGITGLWLAPDIIASFIWIATYR